MRDNRWIETAVRVAEDNGWNVDWSCGRSSVLLEFSKYTPAGQDFMFSVTLEKGAGYADLLAEMDSRIEDFDVDYEAYLWIGKDGHGRNGAPYHIKDVVTDMEAALQMLEDLQDSLQQWLSENGEENFHR